MAIPVPTNVAGHCTRTAGLPSMAQLSIMSVMDCMTGKLKTQQS